MSNDFSSEFIEKVRTAHYRQDWRQQSTNKNVFVNGKDVYLIMPGKPGPKGSKKVGEAWQFVPPEMPGGMPGMPQWGKDAMRFLENHNNWDHEIPEIQEDEALLWLSFADTNLRDDTLDGYPYAETRIVSHDTRGYFWYSNEMAEDWLIIVKYPSMPTWKGEDWFSKYGGYPGWDTRNGRKFQ